MGWLEKWGLKLTSAKVEVEVEAELGKIMSFLVATNVVASRTPKRRPTGTPTARAKKAG